MYYNTTKPQYRAAPTTANNSALLYGTAARPTASLSSACTKKISALEQELTRETGRKIVLVAYHGKKKQFRMIAHRVGGRNICPYFFLFSSGFAEVPVFCIDSVILFSFCLL